MKTAFLKPAAYLVLAILVLCPQSASASPFASSAGKKFVFLPDPRKQDYDAFTVVRASGKKLRQFDGGSGLRYGKFAEKTIICTAVQPERLIFRVPDYGIDIACSLASYTDGQRDHDLLNFVPALAPLSEISTVRQAYAGKTVWVNTANSASHNSLAWPYDPVRKRVIQTFTNNRLQRADLPEGTQLTVTDVRWGDDIAHPVRLVVRDSAGHFFCYDVAADRTNKGLPAGTPLDTAEQCLSKARPAASGQLQRLAGTRQDRGALKVY